MQGTVACRRWSGLYGVWITQANTAQQGVRVCVRMCISKASNGCTYCAIVKQYFVFYSFFFVT